MKYIYVCGPTVYNKVHIGNIRPILTFDIYNRAQKALNKNIFFIHNITDIDDKIINQAKLEKKTEVQIAQQYTNFYLNIMQKYNILKPDAMPSVTNTIKEIIELIKSLIDKKVAYLSNGSIYFNTKIFPNYGKISNRDKAFNETTVEINQDKKNIDDFVLWKSTSKGIKYDSPWSKGRPGWHTECVAIILKYTKTQNLEIHGGGIDLLFPHHENENIQYFALTKKNISKNWKHVGKINFQNQKMSKSKGNIILADQFIVQYGKDTFRYILLSTNPTMPVDFSTQFLKNSMQLVSKFKKTFFIALVLSTKNKKNMTSNQFSIINQVLKLLVAFKFSQALKIIHKLVKDFNKKQNQENAVLIFKIFKTIGFHFANQNYANEIQSYLNWNSLKAKLDYKKADELRKKLLNKGLI